MKLELIISSIGIFICGHQAYALIDPGQVALLASIAASAKETVGALKNTVSLLEVSDEMRRALSNQEDDLDSLSELFEEVSPDGTLSPTERDSLNGFKQYQDRMALVDGQIYTMDGVKWDAQYLKMRADRMNPKRLANVLRTATRAVRLGKKLARLFPKSHEEQTAQNTEILKEQNHAIGKAVIDIRSEVRTMNEREAKNAIDGTIHTIGAIEQMQNQEEGILRKSRL